MPLVSINKDDKQRSSDTLEVYLLGVVDFESALIVQERLVYEISGRNDRQAGLLICEHPPAMTIGREGSRSQIQADQRELDSRQLDVRWLNRGGGCLVHAPGQLAVYPIVPLDRLEIGLSEYRRRLEQSVIEMCRELRVPAYRRPEVPGVWCRCGRFADVGIAVRSWVAYHGLFINVSPMMDLMRLVKPLSPTGEQFSSADDRVTSLAAQRLRSTSMHAVREGIIRHLAAQLGYGELHLYTGHPQLKRTTRKVYAHA